MFQNLRPSGLVSALFEHYSPSPVLDTSPNRICKAFSFVLQKESRSADALSEPNDKLPATLNHATGKVARPEADRLDGATRRHAEEGIRCGGQPQS
jgi:hypothetical protein